MDITFFSIGDRIFLSGFFKFKCGHTFFRIGDHIFLIRTNATLCYYVILLVKYNLYSAHSFLVLWVWINCFLVQVYTCIWLLPKKSCPRSASTCYWKNSNIYDTKLVLFNLTLNIFWYNFCLVLKMLLYLLQTWSSLKKFD